MLQALAISVAVMVAISPQVLKQISFQLSFAAMAGIALALPYQTRVTAALRRWRTTSNGRQRPWMGSILTLGGCFPHRIGRGGASNMAVGCLQF